MKYFKSYALSYALLKDDGGLENGEDILFDVSGAIHVVLVRCYSQHVEIEGDSIRFVLFGIHSNRWRLSIQKAGERETVSMSLNGLYRSCIMHSSGGELNVFLTNNCTTVLKTEAKSLCVHGGSNSTLIVASKALVRQFDAREKLTIICHSSNQLPNCITFKTLLKCILLQNFLNGR